MPIQPGTTAGSVYNVTPPTAADGQSISLQSDVNGKLLVAGTFSGTVSENIASVAGVTLGASAVVNYGSTPAASAVMGVNAFVTNAVTVAQGTAANLNATVVFPSAQPVTLTSTTITGTVAVTQSTSPWVVSGSGNFTVVQPTASNLNANVTIVGPIGQTTKAGSVSVTIASDQATSNFAGTVPGTAPANTTLVGAIYNSTPPTATNGQTLPLQTNASGALLVSSAITGTAAVTQSGTWTVQIGNTPNTTAILANPAPTTTGGLGAPFSAQVTTVVAVKASAGNLYNWSVMNTTSAIAYIQVWNLGTGSITLGTTAPTWVIPVPANGTTGAGNNLGLQIPYSFGTALSIAATTTRTGLTTAACDCLFFYN